MKQKLINSQLTNYNTYLMYKNQMLSLAQNVFLIENLPEFIDISYINKTLLYNGAIAFFVDEELGLLALPFTNIGKLDVYGRPLTIQVFSATGYTKKLSRNEFVIMYDNNSRKPLYFDILQYSERIALITRVMDINVEMQKTPRIWSVPKNMEKSFNDMINNIDGNVERVSAYKDLDIDEITSILSPAPYVTDKLQEQKDKLWNEFLRFIGIANLSFEKKERNIRDEIYAMQGGTIASRFDRYTPRKRAIELINKKFKQNLKLLYYDGLPNNYNDNINLSKGVNNDL